jgi:hypothetical protein
MADTKISALTDGNPAQSGDEIPIARSGANYKITAGSIASLGGDVDGPASSVDNQIALFDSTTGKLIKAATTTGVLKATSGVVAAATSGTDYVAPAGAFSGLSWQSVQTTGFTAVAFRAYPCNTTSAAFTVTLPASPSAGDQITLTDYAGTFGTNNLTINPNGNKIRGSTSNQVIYTNDFSVQLVYIDSTKGWLVDSAVTADPFSQPQPTPTVRYLVVAGGGGGGSDVGGGGGAGGFRTDTNFSVTSGSAITVTVGTGGAGGAGGSGNNGTKGNSSSFSTITAEGGGYGGKGGGSAVDGGSGGSGGGAGGYIARNGGAASTSPSGQGNAGGGSTAFNGSTGPWASGGGGGAKDTSPIGTGGSGTNSPLAGGVGGAGKDSDISGSTVTYAGGGGGSYYNLSAGTGAGASGGSGGGGAGGGYPNPSAVAGTNGLGGGGGGGSGGYSAGAKGGDGVVIISYSTAYRAATTTGSPTYTTSGGNRIYTFTGNGTITF